MMGLIIFIHVIVCILLIIIILIQAGRGGGLVEGFSGVESMFGPKTNAFLTRATAILSVTFFCTCLTLAFLSAKQSRSLMKGIKVEPDKIQTQTPTKEEAVKQEAPKQEVPQQAPKELPKTE